MSVLDTARDHYVSRQASFAKGLDGDPGWLARLRSEAIGCFAERGLPTIKVEDFDICYDSDTDVVTIIPPWEG